jgi:hypothetical protein
MFKIFFNGKPIGLNGWLQLPANLNQKFNNFLSAERVHRATAGNIS